MERREKILFVGTIVTGVLDILFLFLPILDADIRINIIVWKICPPIMILLHLALLVGFIIDITEVKNQISSSQWKGLIAILIFLFPLYFLIRSVMLNDKNGKIRGVIIIILCIVYANIVLFELFIDFLLGWAMTG